MTALVLLAVLVALLVALAAGDVRAAWARWERRCPSCSRHAARSECTRCELYLCAGCSRWVSWNFGADDDMPEHCDDCWALAHGADA